MGGAARVVLRCPPRARHCRHSGREPAARRRPRARPRRRAARAGASPPDGPARGPAPRVPGPDRVAVVRIILLLLVLAARAAAHPLAPALLEITETGGGLASVRWKTSV